MAAFCADKKGREKMFRLFQCYFNRPNFVQHQKVTLAAAELSFPTSNG
jgi:hypothetical protein